MRPSSSKAIATGSTTSGSHAASSTLNPFATLKVACSSRGDSGPLLPRPGADGVSADSGNRTQSRTQAGRRASRRRMSILAVGDGLGQGAVYSTRGVGRNNYLRGGYAGSATRLGRGAGMADGAGANSTGGTAPDGL